MTPELAAIYTVLLLVLTNLFGLGYSYLVLHTSIFKAFRIQDKVYKNGALKDRMPLYLFNLFILLTISGVGAYFFFPFFETNSFNLWIIVAQVIVAFIADDIWFYFMHRYMHENKFLLKKIHSIHHRSSTPFPLEYLYAHPVEWMSGMLGALLAFAVIMIFMPINIYAFWLFGLLRNLHEIHIHSDLELPYLSKIPLLSKTKHHDDHHAFLNGNYASTFLWLDRLFKTNFTKK